MSRAFRTDFLIPALKGLSPLQQKRVGLALDCAIAFGALEAQQGNESLKDGPELRSQYHLNTKRLQSGQY
jgi:hypothetical protein